MPSVVGTKIEDLDTPCLLLDIQKCDRNLKKMADFFKGKACRLRPHFKNHKCVTLARRQIAAGSAAGLTCAKLGEAEVLAEHGFDDILVANQVVGPPKVKRLIEVAKKTKIAVAVDAIEQAAAISEAASDAKVTVGILLEVDLGMARCGAQPGEESLKLAQQIVTLPGLRFEGIQAYEGHTVYITDAAQRDKMTRQAMQKAVDTGTLLEQHGVPCRGISGGASSTYATVGVMPRMLELQCGTYATMDWRYNELVPEFEIAMTVLARVISKHPGRAVLDIGVKGAGGEFGLPRIKGHPNIEIPFFLAEEHCAMKNVPEWRVGDVVEFIPSHACTTCNLYREFYVHDREKVVDVWPIEAAGKLS